jgi:hypothetical protein
LFADIDRPCASFSTWWNRATRGLTRLSDLPGLQALVEQDPAEPLFGPAAAMPSPPLPEDGAACSKRMSA